MSSRKLLHRKRVQLPQDFLGTPTWPPFHSFGMPIWRTWRHVKKLYSYIFFTGQTLSHGQTDVTTPNVVDPIILGVVASVCTQLRVWPFSNLTPKSGHFFKPRKRQTNSSQVQAAQAWYINYREFLYCFAYYQRLKNLYKKFKIALKT